MKRDMKKLSVKIMAVVMMCSLATFPVRAEDQATGSSENLNVPQVQAPPAGEPQVQTPPAGEPQEQAPPAGEPQEQAPPAGEPQEQAPPVGEPQEQTPPAGEPQEQAPPTGEPQEQAPPAVEPQVSAPTTEVPVVEAPPVAPVIPPVEILPAPVVVVEPVPAKLTIIHRLVVEGEYEDETVVIDGLTTGQTVDLTPYLVPVDWAECITAEKTAYLDMAEKTVVLEYVLKPEMKQGTENQEETSEAQVKAEIPKDAVQ